MNANSLIYVFPGQGTQVQGMGDGLFEKFPDITRAADETLGYSIKSLCLDNPDNKLNQTEYTQPALYTVNAMTYLSIKQETGRTPDFVAGHSLGEYNALFASGAFDFVSGLRLVQKRGELMAQATGGGMAAIIGLTRDQIRDVMLLYGSPEVSIANLNSPKQTVISGSMSVINDIQSSFEEAGAKLFLPLPVSGAFHSRFMEPARRQFEAFLKNFKFNRPNIPVISNVEASPYPTRGISELLAKQVTSPVRWVESMQYLLRQPNPTFREIGPGDTLQTLLHYIMN